MYNLLSCSLTLIEQTIQAYQTALPGTTAWKLRLLELVTTACHDIAVYLYQMDDGVHKHAEHKAWREHKLETLPKEDVMGRKQLPPPTVFWTGAYMDWSHYPNGLADMAGYWAEIQLFGGVVLFDRGESEEEVSIQTRHYIKKSLTSELEHFIVQWCICIQSTLHYYCASNRSTV